MVPNDARVESGERHVRDLTSHALQVAFTGSTEIGRLVGNMAAANIKPCTLELGGD